MRGRQGLAANSKWTSLGTAILQHRARRVPGNCHRLTHVRSIVIAAVAGPWRSAWVACHSWRSNRRDEASRRFTDR